MNLNKKLVSISVAILAVAIVAIVAVSLAFYSSAHDISNVMSTGTYSDVMTERFEPDSNWEPGEAATKEVGVTNTGDYDLIVRVKIVETWTEKLPDDAASDATAEVIKSLAYGDTGFNPISSTTGLQYIDGSGITTNATIDGITTYDNSVVYKDLNFDESKWVYEDGYLYYKTLLASGETTGNFLNSITLCDDTDMGEYLETKYFIVSTSTTEPAFDIDTVGNAGEWEKVTDDNPLPTDVATGTYLYIRAESATTSNTGYADADYVLVITSQNSQASYEAIDATFGEGNSDYAIPSGTNWGIVEPTADET